jgi:hypothetical protein
MSAVLHILAIVHSLDLLRNIYRNNNAPAFTTINRGISLLRLHNLTRLECVEALECVLQEPSFC